MQRETVVNEIEKIELDNPIFIEGLPGIGFVGKIVVDQLTKQLDAKKFAELESDYFPPQVTVKKDGLIEHMKNEFFYVKDVGEDNQDLILLTGNTQGTDFEGQTQVSRVIMNFVEQYNIQKVITLGGLGTGEMIEENRIFIAGNSTEFIEEVCSIDNAQIRKDEGGGIVGASGLLIYYAQKAGIDAVCLMGETPGFYIDPSAAKEMLLVLFKLLNFEIPLDELNEKVEDTLRRLENTAQFNQGLKPQMKPSDDHLRYIG